MQGKFCSQPWKAVTVEGNGAVYSCNCAYWTNLPIGNILKEPLEDIYARSTELKNLRASVLNGTYDWCVESDCNEIQNLPSYTPDLNPYVEFKTDPAPRLPINLTLAIDNNCNLKCLSCRNEKTFSNRVNPMTKQMLDSLSESYKHVDKQIYVMLDGSGDIFVSAAYNEFLFSRQLPRCWQLEILTNGNLLVKKKNEIEAIKHQISYMTVSLDAGSAETYAITRGGNFDTVLKGIELLKELNIITHLQFVLQSANYKDLLEYKKIADKFGVSYGVQKIDYRPHMPNNYWQQAQLDNNPNIDNTLLKEYLSILQNDPNCNLDGGTRWLLAKL